MKQESLQDHTLRLSINAPSSHNMNLLRRIVCRKSKHTFSVHFFLENRAFMRSWEKIWRSRTCHRRQRGTCAFYGYKNTLRISNNYCIWTAPQLDESVAVLSFTYSVYVVCYSSNMTGKICEVYIYVIGVKDCHVWFHLPLISLLFMIFISSLFTVTPIL